jgi:hypothetical protein
MSDLNNLEKRQIESILQMGGGYVLDFSNRTFAEFIEESIGLEAYADKYGKGSKANVLRAIWKLEPNHVVGKVVGDLVDYAMEVRSDIDGQQSTKCKLIADRLLQGAPVIDIDSITAKSAKRDFAGLVKLVKDAIDRNEPETGLDRLHTFMVKYFRILCEKHGIAIKRDKPLHSLAGEYIKFLKVKGYLHSEMTERILKSSLSILDAFNGVRNNQSFAHDNSILNYDESLLIFNNITSVIKFVESLEKQIDTD